MLELKYENSFLKDYKVALKRKSNLSLLKNCVSLLLEEQKLEPNYRDHALVGEWKGFRECHLKDDWLLVYRYQVINGIKTLCLVRLGRHCDIFND